MPSTPRNQVRAAYGPSLCRRALLGTAAAVALGARSATAQQAPAATPNIADPTYPFALPPLPYAFDALAPHIDARTMELHHDKHHAAYVTNLNAALKDNGTAAALPLSKLLARLTELPEPIRAAVRNNGGGHALHTMFWTVMGGRGGEPGGPLAQVITRDLGGLAQLRTGFDQAGLRQFGSGWTMVLVDPKGTLSLAARPNQDSPLLEGKRVLFGNDVWEHAYYLTYQNRRADYLAAWWNVLDWTAVARRYQDALAGTLTV